MSAAQSIIDASQDVSVATAATVLTLGDIDPNAVRQLFANYGLGLVEIACGQPIPGSYWGEPEAGIIGNTVYARADTPLHSLLHEACHLIVLSPEKRAAVHTDATDSVEEEDAVCILQILLGEMLPGVSRERLFADMDTWGYTFRLGSTQAYFEQDAQSAWAWLRKQGLTDAIENFCAFVSIEGDMLPSGGD